MKISRTELKLSVEKICNKMGILYKRIILFGSRARGDYDIFSDYDLLIIVNEDINIKRKRMLSKKIRETLAKKLIGSDVIIKSLQEVDYFKDKIGSVVKNALKEGVVL